MQDDAHSQAYTNMFLLHKYMRTTKFMKYEQCQLSQKCNHVQFWEFLDGASRIVYLSVQDVKQLHGWVLCCLKDTTFVSRLVIDMHTYRRITCVRTLVSFTSATNSPCFKHTKVDNNLDALGISSSNKPGSSFFVAKAINSTPSKVRNEQLPFSFLFCVWG